MMKPAISAMCVFVLLLAMPLLAHHEFAFDATYDGNPITITGKVVRVDLVNPHVLIQIESVDSAGKVVRWVLEGSGVAHVRQNGFDKSTLKSGDTITACGFPGKADTVNKHLSAERITVPGGQKLSFMRFDEKFMTSVSSHCQ